MTDYTDQLEEARQALDEDLTEGFLLVADDGENIHVKTGSADDSATDMGQMIGSLILAVSRMTDTPSVEVGRASTEWAINHDHLPTIHER